MALKWQFSCSNGHAEVTWKEMVTNQKLQELQEHQQYYYRNRQPTPSDPDGPPPSQGTKADWACCATCGNMLPAVTIADV